MRVDRRSLVHMGTRELSFVAVAAAGAWLFLNHDLFYLSGDFALGRVSQEAFALTTVVAYLFLRSIVLVAGARVPRFRDGVEVCPECGQPIHDEAFHGVPSEAPAPAHVDEVTRAAIALRRAIVDARAAGIVRTRADRTASEVPGSVENPAPPVRVGRPGDRVVVRRVVRKTRRLQDPSETRESP